MPVCVHRFVPSGRLAPRELEAEVLDELVRFVDVTGVVPVFEEWAGRIDLTPAEQAGSKLCSAVIGDGGEEDEGHRGARFVHHVCEIGVDIGVVEKHLKRERDGKGLGSMPGVRWTGRIKALGFGYMFASQDLKVGSKEANVRLESQR